MKIRLGATLLSELTDFATWLCFEYFDPFPSCSERRGATGCPYLVFPSPAKAATLEVQPPWGYRCSAAEVPEALPSLVEGLECVECVEWVEWVEWSVLCSGDNGLLDLLFRL